MYFLYSAHVVAPIVRRLPRASAGFSRLAASPVPAAPPAPTSVCTSSMNRMIGLGLDCTSSMTWRRRCSNSPFMLAPACSRPRSSDSSETSFSCGGTSPRASRCAKPSTTAVLPTPASPVRMGLFWRRRIRMSTICRISSSRPFTGSILPSRARAVRSAQNFFSASCLPIAAGAIAPLSVPGSPPTPAARPLPSCAPSAASALSPHSFWKLSARSSGLMRSNWREMASSALRRLLVFSMPSIRKPLRTWACPNISVP